jgi:hypothetical protein
VVVWVGGGGLDLQLFHFCSFCVNGYVLHYSVVNENKRRVTTVRRRRCGGLGGRGRFGSTAVSLL